MSEHAADTIAPVRITTTQVQQELEDAQKATLLKYYEIDDSDPFRPKFRLRAGFEIVLSPGELQELGPGLDFANWVVIKNRRRAYDRLRSQKPQLKPLVSAGDSWFLHPLLRDVINQLIDGRGYAVYSLDAAGAELSQLVNDERWGKALNSENAKTFLLSGGGNDLMGTHFGDYLNAYKPDDGSGPARFLNDAFEDALRRVCNYYRQILDSVKENFPGVRVFTHSYDYALPRKGKKGKWLGSAMEKRGLVDGAQQRACIRLVVDRFTDELRKICANEYAGLAFYVTRFVNVGEMQWDDEIHPTNDGFAVAAANFHAALKAADINP
jgi:hypothetical protein